MKKLTYYLISAALAAFVLSACANQQTPAAEEIATSTSADAEFVTSEGVIAEGHLTPARDTTLSFQGAGTVMEVKAKTGDKVKKGDVLARLGGVSDAAYAAAQLELVNAQQGLKDLQENADAARAQSLIDVDNAQEAYDKAVDYYDSLFKPYKYDELVFIKKMTPFGVKRIPEIRTRKIKKADEETIAEAKNDMDLKLASLENATRAAARLKDGPDTDQLAQAEARLALAEAQVRAGEEAIANLELRAPFDGVVCNLNVRAGEWVTPGIPILRLGDLGDLRVETTDLSEIDAARVHPQDTVLVTFDALPDVVVNGTVLRVANKAAEGSGVNYTAVVLLDTIPADLRWGMTAFADIEV